MILSALISRVRPYLADTTPTASGVYIWSNQVLTDIYNELLRDLTSEIGAIEDRATAATCTFAYLADATTISVHSAIRAINRAKIAAETEYLELTDRATIDASISDWEGADSSTPTKLIISGIGNNIVRLYPPALVSGTLSLDVIRAPLTDAVYATDAAVECALGIESYILIHGIVARALIAGDVDAENYPKSERHEKLYLATKEQYKRMLVRKNMLPQQGGPHPGMIC